MKINAFLEKRFNYLHTARAKWMYIISATIFVYIFLIVFQPYGLHEEMRNPANPNLHKFLFLVSISFSTVISLSLSQHILRPLLGFQSVTNKKYVIWFFCETFLITLVTFIFSFIVPDLGDDFEEELNVAFQLANYFKAFIILLFPFFGTIVYEFIQRLNEELNELSAQLTEYQNTFKKVHEDDHVNIKDENGNEVIKLQLKDFLLAESGNQYVIVYYLEDQRLKKEIVRNRLKNLLSDIPDSSVYQCHRSYIINLLNVSHLEKKEGKNYLLLYQDAGLIIPVSKSYLEEIRKVLEVFHSLQIQSFYSISAILLVFMGLLEKFAACFT
ncbi:hypothetical protein NBRC110019_19530 [Neptunitalea chrysea]|uniref:HTH LytTR-type domain-containing protein n=1 Tax=Neptunitalea chrysea TaxID=1647581 RepID=A0A9W6EWG2_9FLAO|nr:LytTR family transcriptional regulator DNA-binding domain-containing protein [Neptunitalea chrysea]GLB52913.1 hypothetical protein NBRC110019_19530 [Neptunitalea chrysea]